VAHADFDPLLLDQTRLSVASLLAATRSAEFGWVRDSVGVSDSALSKQVATLNKQGYVEVEKGYVGKRPRTWLNLSDAGRAALQAHVAALQRIVEQSQQTGAAHRAESAESPPGRGV
jgi:DNA-binding MarR family transcriptional regulator